MLDQALLPPSADLELTEVVIEEAAIIVTARSTQVTVMCPDCQEPSEHVHSHYWRTAADLPCAERQVRLELCVRRLFCDNPSCKRRPSLNVFPHYSRLSRGGRHGWRRDNSRREWTWAGKPALAY